MLPLLDFTMQSASEKSESSPGPVAQVCSIATGFKFCGRVVVVIASQFGILELVDFPVTCFYSTFRSWIGIVLGSSVSR